MTNPRHSRRQQHLDPEREPVNDIDRRGTRRRHSEPTVEQSTPSAADAHVADLQSLHATYIANNGTLPDTTTTEQPDNQSVSALTNMGTHDLSNTEQPPSSTQPGIQDVVATPGHIVGGVTTPSDRQTEEIRKSPQLLQGMYEAVTNYFSGQHSAVDDSDHEQPDPHSQEVEDVCDNSEQQSDIDEAMPEAESQSERSAQVIDNQDEVRASPPREPQSDMDETMPDAESQHEPYTQVTHNQRAMRTSQPRQPPTHKRGRRGRRSNKHKILKLKSKDKLAKPTVSKADTENMQTLIAQQKAMLEQIAHQKQQLDALSTPPPDPRPGHPANNKRRRSSFSSNADAGSLVAGAGQPQRKRAHHGLGYTSPATRSTASSGHNEDVLRYVRDQALANRNPHGPEALANRHAALSKKANKQQASREFESDAASDTIPVHNHLNTGAGPPPSSSDDSSSMSSIHSQANKPTSVPTATPEAIAAGRQRLHARILKLSEELCKAVDKNDTARITAIQPVLETLRSAFESKAVDKRRVPQPKNWPEFPAARYHLNNIMERDTRGALLEAWKNAQIAQLDESWSLTWFYKVLNNFKAEKSTLDYIRDNMETLKVWTPILQIERICSHETQATVDPAMRKLTKGYALDQKVTVMEQMTQLMEQHRRARERCDTDKEFRQNLLNHCIVQLLETALNGRSYERTLQLHPKWHLMETHELIQLLSPDIQAAQQRVEQRNASRHAATQPGQQTPRGPGNGTRTPYGARQRQANNPSQRPPTMTPTTCQGCQQHAPQGARHIPTCHHYRAAGPQPGPSAAPTNGTQRPSPQFTTGQGQHQAPRSSAPASIPAATRRVNTITHEDEEHQISEGAEAHIATLLSEDYGYEDEQQPEGEPSEDWESIPEQ